MANLIDRRNKPKSEPREPRELPEDGLTIAIGDYVQANIDLVSVGLERMPPADLERKKGEAAEVVAEKRKALDEAIKSFDRRSRRSAV
jgi:hypothetical protein